MTILRTIIVALLIVVLTTSAAPEKRAKDGNFELIILHNNDMHARFEQTNALSSKCKTDDAESNKCYGGFARVAHEVREYRRKAEAGEIPPVLYLNAGDTYTGTPWFSLYKDNITSNFLNLLKPDAISLGNHEFDEGTENLGKFLAEINFPVLVANIDIEKEPALKSDNLKPSTVLEVDGERIGIIGYLTPETKEVAIPNEVEFIDEIGAINDEATKLKNDGVNIIIALGHSGLERDKEIASQCPDIDLVIGGHSHSFLYTGEPPDWENPEDDYPLIIQQTNGKKVPVVQAYAFTKYLGYLDLEFDNNGDLVSIKGTPILLNSVIPRDADVLELLEIYRPGILELENEIVGTTKVLLDGSCRRTECNLGNLIADSMVDWHALNYDTNDYWTDASIGFIQGGGVRASIDHKSNGGQITKEDAATVLPFGSKIVILELTGQELLAALEHSVHRHTDGGYYGEFMQMSGLQVTYNMNHPSGSRVVDAKVLCAQCYVPVLEDLDKSKKYRIVTQDFLAGGGDGYEMFVGKTVESFEELEIDVFIPYLKKKSPIHQAVEWRITVIDVIDPVTDVIASTKVLLDGECVDQECNLGNFITDAIVDWYALEYTANDYWTDASVALLQGSRIKASIDHKQNNGTITKNDAIKVFQPAFFNIVAITLTGQELVDLLEFSVSKFDDENSKHLEFLQMSGMQVVYDLNKPAGQRVVDLKILCAQCYVPELELVNLSKDYKVLMQSILAAGADGFSEVINEKLIDDLNESDANIFMKYLTKKSPVHPAVEWRITMIQKNVETTTEVGPTTISTLVPTTETSSTEIPISSSEIPTTSTLGASNLQMSFILIVVTLIVNLVKN